METSILIARIFGILYMSLGIGMLLNSNIYKTIFVNLLENTSVLIFGGVLAIVMGVSMITYHNYWNSDWTVIVTIIGWIALFKGILLLILPGKFVFFKPLLASDNFYKLLGPFALIFGLVLGYFSFF